MFEKTTRKRGSAAHRLAGAVDLVVDFATLGQYGLEPLPVARGRCELDGHRVAWEALATPRRGSCGTGRTLTLR